MGDITIPANFQYLDTRVTDADQCVNARDRHVARQNWNALVAARVAQPIFTLSVSADTDGSGSGATRTTDPLSYTLGSTHVTADAQFGVPIVEVPIFIPPLAQTGTLHLRGFELTSAETNDVEVYPLVSCGNDFGELSVADRILVNSADTPANFTVTLYFPPTHDEYEMAKFTLYVKVPMRDADYGGGNGTIDDAANSAGQRAPAYLDAASGVGDEGNASVGDMIYIKDSGGTLRSEIRPKSILAIQALSGGGSRYWLDAGWEALPLPGSDVWLLRGINSLKLESLSLSADAVTDPHAEILR